MSGTGAANEQSNHAPDFELPRHGAIREHNWSEYQASGFQPVFNSDGSTLSLNFAQALYGVEHIYTGDPYDDDAQRPLQYKPGTGIYTDPEGLKLIAEKEQAWEERRRARKD